MQPQSPADFYASQKSLYATQLAAATSRIRQIAGIRLVTMLVAIGFLVMAINTGAAWQWWLTAACTAVFLVWVRLHSRLHYREKLLKIHVFIIEQEQAALAGNHSSFGDGAAWVTSTHPYSFDLDIFGKGSVYQLLNRTVTENGSVLLAERLMKLTADKQQIADHQHIIQALSGNPAFLEDFRVAGMSVEEEKEDALRVRHWLNAPDDFISSGIAKAAVFTMPAVTLGFLIYSAFTGSLHAGVMIAVAVNWLVILLFQKPVKAANAHIGRTARLVEKYQRLQEQTAMQEFTHPWLQGVAAQSRQALIQILRFRKLANTFDSRNNSMVGPLMNSFFVFDVYCLLRLEWWRKSHKTLLLETMDAMIQLDVFISAATYAFNHPENTYPVIDTEGTAIRAVNLRHPLLHQSAVGNDCTLGDQEQFYLLTGANMTGKSTFIRTIGISVVLSYLGVPVPAGALTVPLLNMYTSIRVSDSVQDDVSYFRAELNRIRDIMDAVKAGGQTWLVLLDEPLRGTNSGDKQQGTRSILESLLTHKAIGIVATHDIGLCSLSDVHPGQVSNYHFESKIAAEGLTFDFRLYPGGSTSNNATVLMRQMGIITSSSYQL